jgi:two-component system response regulator GlrR
MMTKSKILIVDDDKNLLELLRIRLESSGYEVVAVLSKEDAVREMRNRVFDLSIIDQQLPDTSGIALMEELHLINPEMPAIILTAYGSIESAVEAMKRGAYNYLTKPFDARELLFQIENALRSQGFLLEIKRLKELIEERYDFKNIVAKSEKMKKVLEKVSLVAKTDSTVAVLGESGTGKELVARAIHFASERKSKPFVAVHSAAIPETLLESELFGHEKGAFTGAIRSTKGYFVQAHEGTIFLDEIGDMPLSIQAKLLRVLQERQFYPIGTERPVEINVRVIVATNRNLEVEVKEGRFREDLFYRILVIPITLPPLRERKEDIPTLVDLFLKEFSQQMKKEIKGVTPSAMQKLMLHDWPGNVRELKNTIEYAVTMTRHEVITEELILQGKSLSQDPLITLKEARDSFEKTYLIRLLDITSGNVTKAAKLAGKYRADFYNLLKKHNIRTENFKRF